MDVIPIFIGYDTQEKTAFTVCEHTLLKNSSQPLHIQPLLERELRHIGLYKRRWEFEGEQTIDSLDGKPFSTEFSFTRFLVPSLTQFKGWALFCDCDFLWRGDVAKLWALRKRKYAIMCVKHNYRPTEKTKMDGKKQTLYRRKNWSSMVLWNCSHPAHGKYLTPDAVNWKWGQWLHAFSWLDDKDIGQIPEEWNWLEGWSDKEIDPQAVHFTRGGPWFDEYKDVAYADEWAAAAKEVYK